MKLASIALHFDSLAQACGFPEGFDDPSYFALADRLLEVADRLKFRYTIFVIGRDLDGKPRHQQQLRQWAAAGHEIGNHSYSHRNDFGAMGAEKIIEELRVTQQLIQDAIGKPARGFAAPNWSTSDEHLAALRELGFHYDASVFPSYFRFPLNLEGARLHFKQRSGRVNEFMRQKHFSKMLLPRYRRAFVYGDSADGVVLLPLPTTSWGIPCWHTPVFSWGWDFQEKVMRACLARNDHFYYVVHPADLLDPRDVRAASNIPLPRVGIPFDRKKDVFERALSLISESGRRIVTMAELADQVKFGARLEKRAS